MVEKIVCIGDSLTAGYGVEEGYGWTDILQSRTNTKIINSGLSGDTTTGMLVRFRTRVLNHKPSHVIIMGGTNDLLLKLGDELILSNIHAMIRHARHAGIIPVIGLPTTVFSEGTVDDYGIYASMSVLRNRLHVYRDKLRKLCILDEIQYIDFTRELYAVQWG